MSVVRTTPTSRSVGVVRPRRAEPTGPPVGADGRGESRATHLDGDAEPPALRTVGGGPGCAGAGADVVGGHRLDRGSRQQPGAVGQPAAGQQQAAEGVQVVEGGHEAAAAGWERRRLGPLSVGRVVDRALARFRVRRIARTETIDVWSRESGVDHSQRCEHPLLQEDVERLTGRPGDEDAEHVRSGVVQPPFARLVEEGQRRQPAHPLVRLGRLLRFGRAAPMPRSLHRFEQRLGPRRLEVHADPETERQDVVHRDRPMRRDGVALDRAPRVDEHPPVGELGKQVVDRVLEPEPALLDEDERGHRDDRLRHRRDAKDGVAANRLGFVHGSGCPRHRPRGRRRGPRARRRRRRRPAARGLPSPSCSRFNRSSIESAHVTST